MGKTRQVNTGYIVAMCLVMYLIQGATSLITPALAKLAENYSNYSASLVNLIVTIPSLSAILGNLAFGRFIRIGYKKALCIGFAILIISAVAPFFFVDNLILVIATRAVVGVGFGLMFPACTMTIIRTIAPEKQGSMMGFGNTFVAVALTLVYNMVPFLLNISLSAVFLIHLVLLIPLLFVLPVPAKRFELEEQPEAAQTNAASDTKQSFGVKSWFWQILILFNILFYYPICLYVSYVVAEIGGTTADAAIASSVMSVAGALGGAIFGIAIKTLQKRFMVAAFGMMALGFALSAFTGSLLSLYAGCALIGIGNVLVITYSYSMIPQVTPVQKVASANGNMSAFQNAGAFASPILLSSISQMLGHGEVYQFSYVICTVFFVIGTIVFLFLGNRMTADN